MIFHNLSRLFDSEDSPHPVAIRNDSIISFNQLRADVVSFIRQYPNCRAVLLCEDSYNFLVGFLGLIYSNSSLILASKEHPNIAHILQNECDTYIDDQSITNIPKSTATPLAIDPTRLCIDFFTSGSTGAPKRITKSLAMFEREIAILDKILSQKPGTVYSTIPHCHLYGLISKLLWPLASRHPFDTATYVFLEEILNKLAPDSIIISSPVHLRRIAGIAPISTKQRPAQILSAGSALSYADALAVKEILQEHPTEIFGSTETGAVAWRYITKENQGLESLPDIKIAMGDNGCMRILSPVLGENWYESNDLITLSGNCFHFLGRSDGIVKIEGRRVSLARVEEELRQIKYIKDAATFNLPNKPDHLSAIIVLNDSGKEQLAKLGNFAFGRLLRKELSKNLERASIPKLWRFVEAIPTNNMGKVTLEKMEAMF